MINIEHLKFYYTSDKIILDDISLHLEKGAYLSILGENGAGKSTLIKLILNLEKPNKGTVSCKTNRIGYVPQKRETMNGIPITVAEFLHSYQKIIHIQDQTIIPRLMSETGISHLAKQLLGNLSGGQLQRVLITRALIGDPELIILDEPSSGIDVDGQKNLYALIKSVHAAGKTIISVEHNLNAAVAYSSLIFHMAKSKGHLCSPEQYAKEYLGINLQN